jgi:hypothetical protein
MLQVARLAPQQLGESRDLVAAFFDERLNPDGGFQDRAGRSDLYYTVFGLEGLIALQAALPVDRARAFLRTFGDGAGLDFVHLACLARAWAAIAPRRDGVPSRALLDRLETFRSADGGYAHVPGAAHGTIYAAFLALGASQDLGAEPGDPQRLAASILALRSGDGAFGNRPGDARGVTTVTAAAVALLRHLDAPIDPHLRVWLLDRCHASGGFLATPSAPIPDLLSTATALHALSALGAPLAGLRDACLDFTDSLWTNRGGFYGSWADDALDCEYTYYGLLALGHLSI